MKKTCSKYFYDFVRNKYPALRHPDNFALRNLFFHLCFSNFVDLESKRLLIGNDTLSMFEGKHAIAAAKNGNYKGHIFLKEFKENVLPDFKVFGEYKDEGGAWHKRSVANTGFDEIMWVSLTNELKEDNKEVMFIDGRVYNEEAKAYLRVIDKQDHIEKAKTIVVNSTQKLIRDYLENVSGNIFVRLYNSNKEAIHKKVSVLDPDTQNIQYRILDSVKEVPTIHYYPSTRTPRLSASGDTVVGLKSVIRKELCKGLVEIDLKASQFSILASKLDASLCKEIIDNKKDIWKIFFEATGQTDYSKFDEIKRNVFKPIIYGIAFGNGRYETPYIISFNKNLKNKIDKKNAIRLQKGLPEIKNVKYKVPLQSHLAKQSKDYGIDFTILDKHPIVEELFSKREIYFKEIEKNNGAKDVWGNFISIDESKDMGVRHIAAQVMQSFEMEIFSEVFNVANKYREYFTIQIFQHDGATISITRKDKELFLKKYITQSVEEKAKILNINTTIEWTQL